MHVFFFRLILLLSCIWPITATAQDSENDPFCLLASVDLLSALDGSWTLTQNAGVASAAGMVIPLPPHPPQTMNISYDPERTAAIMSAQGQEMMLLPTPPNAVQSALRFMNEAEADGLLSIGDGCDFYELPLVLGSNTYNLDGDTAQSSQGYAVGYTFGDHTDFVCVSKTAYDETFGEPALSEPGGLLGESQILFYNEDAKAAAVLVGGDYQRCAQFAGDIPEPSPGEMVMSLAIKFQTPDTGAGMLYFEGIKDGYKFAAKAPVFLSR